MAYASVADIRALDGMADTTAYPDSVLQAGIDYATKLIDDYCGTSFEFKSFTVTLDGTNDLRVVTGVLFGQTLSSVTIDGQSIGTGNFLHRSGVLVRTDGGIFNRSLYGANVVVAGTAGKTSTADQDIRLVARIIARQFALDTHARTSDRVLQRHDETGQVEILAQAGGPGRPTQFPEANAILNRNKHKPGHTGSVVM